MATRKTVGLAPVETPKHEVVVTITVGMSAKDFKDWRDDYGSVGDAERLLDRYGYDSSEMLTIVGEISPRPAETVVINK